MKKFVFLILYASVLFSDSYYVKMTSSELTEFLHKKGELVEDIVLDDQTIKGIPFQVQLDKNGKEIIRFVSEKNLINFYDIAYRDGLLKCMKDKE